MTPFSIKNFIIYLEREGLIRVETKRYKYVNNYFVHMSTLFHQMLQKCHVTIKLFTLTNHEKERKHHSSNNTGKIYLTRRKREKDNIPSQTYSNRIQWTLNSLGITYHSRRITTVEL